MVEFNSFDVTLVINYVITFILLMMSVRNIGIAVNLLLMSAFSHNQLFRLDLYAGVVTSNAIIYVVLLLHLIRSRKAIFRFNYKYLSVVIIVQLLLFIDALFFKHFESGALSDIAFIAIVYFYFDSSDKVIQSLKLLLVVSLLIALTGFLQFLFGIYRGDFTVSGGVGGYLGNHVAFGFKTGLGALISLALYQMTNEKKYLLVIVPLLAALLISTARGPLVIVSLVLLLYVMVNLSFRQKAQLLIPVLLVIAIVSLSGFSGDIRSRFFNIVNVDVYNEKSINTATSGRLVPYYAVLNIYKEHPWFGIGYRQFSQQFYYYQSRLHFSRAQEFSTHSVYLQYLAELGSVGLICYILFLVYYFRNYSSIKARLKENVTYETLLRFSGYGSLAYILFGVFDNEGGFGDPSHVFYIILPAVIMKIYTNESTLPNK